MIQNEIKFYFIMCFCTHDLCQYVNGNYSTVKFDEESIEYGKSCQTQDLMTFIIIIAC